MKPVEKYILERIDLKDVIFDKMTDAAKKGIKSTFKSVTHLKPSETTSFIKITISDILNYLKEYKFIKNQTCEKIIEPRPQLFCKIEYTKDLINSLKSLSSKCGLVSDTNLCRIKLKEELLRQQKYLFKLKDRLQKVDVNRLQYNNAVRTKTTKYGNEYKTDEEILKDV